MRAIPAQMRRAPQHQPFPPYPLLHRYVFPFTRLLSRVGPHHVAERGSGISAYLAAAVSGGALPAFASLPAENGRVSGRTSDEQPAMTIHHL
jgi:hypothetical protein